MVKFDLALLPPRPDLTFEQALWQQGILQVAGVDEAGRGPLAGPVAAAAVVFPPDLTLEENLPGVRDSKQMTPEGRTDWAVQIKKIAVTWGVGFASPAEIDRLGIVPATRLAVCRAVWSLPIRLEHLLLDYLTIPELPCPQTPLVKGDCRSLSIAAASVLAKTSRDALLCKLDGCFPGYGFANHKGYATAQHLDALQKLGPCVIHRRSFAPIRNPEQALSE